MARDRFETTFPCEDCDREWNSLRAAMLCPCDKYDSNGRERD